MKKLTDNEKKFEELKEVEEKLLKYSTDLFLDTKHRGLLTDGLVKKINKLQDEVYEKLIRAAIQCRLDTIAKLGRLEVKLRKIHGDGSKESKAILKKQIDENNEIDRLVVKLGGLK